MSDLQPNPKQIKEEVISLAFQLFGFARDKFVADLEAIHPGIGDEIFHRLRYFQNTTFHDSVAQEIQQLQKEGSEESLNKALQKVAELRKLVEQHQSEGSE